MTTQQPNAVQRYKVGYRSDEWGMSSSTPSCIPAHDGAWVRFADMQELQAGYDAARLENVQLRAQLEAIGAGGVEPLRKRGGLHHIEETLGMVSP